MFHKHHPPKVRDERIKVHEFQSFQMLVTPPRIIDAALGLAYILIYTLTFILMYLVVIQEPSNPENQYTNFFFISYGYVQGLIGFFAGVFLARITQSKRDEPSVIADCEEEELMLIDSLPV